MAHTVEVWSAEWRSVRLVFRLKDDMHFAGEDTAADTLSAVLRHGVMSIELRDAASSEHPYNVIPPTSSYVVERFDI